MYVWQYESLKKNSLNENTQKEKAYLREIFFEGDSYSIEKITRWDLQKYMIKQDIADLKTVPLLFIKPFLQKLCLVYKQAPIFKFDDKVKEEEQLKFYKLMDEVNLNPILNNTFLKMRLHNTILTRPIYYEPLDKLTIDNSFNVGNTKVIGFPGMREEMQFIVKKEKLGAKDHYREEYYIWDRLNEWNYKTLDEPVIESNVIINDKYMPIEGMFEFDFTETYFPFTKHQYEDQNYGFWGLGLDDLVEINKMVHLLLMVLSDDTLFETMRLLILKNFVPMGNEAKKTPGSLLVGGMRHPLGGVSSREGVEPSAELISAELYTEDIIKYIDELIDKVSALYGIDNPLSKELSAELPGVSVKLRNLPLIANWQRDIQISKKLDKQLISKIIEVNNFHRDKKRNIKPEIVDNLTIDYQVSWPANDLEEFQLKEMNWKYGIGNPLQEMMRQNPEWSREKCIEEMKTNIEFNNEMFGISLPKFDMSQQESEDIIG